MKERKRKKKKGKKEKERKRKEKKRKKKRKERKKEKKKGKKEKKERIKTKQKNHPIIHIQNLNNADQIDPGEVHYHIYHAKLPLEEVNDGLNREIVGFMNTWFLFFLIKQ